MNENKNIQNNSLSDDELLKYLNDEISAEEANNLEKKMLTDPFLTDAVEGLEKYSSIAQLRKDVHSIESKLKQQLNTKPERKKREIKNLNLALYLVFFIIIILLIAFVILHGFK